MTHVHRWVCLRYFFLHNKAGSWRIAIWHTHFPFINNFLFMLLIAFFVSWLLDTEPFPFLSWFSMEQSQKTSSIAARSECKQKSKQTPKLEIIRVAIWVKLRPLFPPFSPRNLGCCRKIWQKTESEAVLRFPFLFRSVCPKLNYRTLEAKKITEIGTNTPVLHHLLL